MQYPDTQARSASIASAARGSALEATAAVRDHFHKSGGSKFRPKELRRGDGRGAAPRRSAQGDGGGLLEHATPTTMATATATATLTPTATPTVVLSCNTISISGSTEGNLPI